jgi:hypothetical protein
LEQGYNNADIILGGDHGARRFCCIVRLILRNNNSHEINPLSVVITIGNLDYAKDDRLVLESTFFPSLNDHLWLIVGKFIAIQCVQDNNAVYFSDKEQPPPCDNSSIINLSSRIFLAGDMAFFATVLGKENMSSKWCNCCNLSAKDWSLHGHHHGELWTLEMIENI